MSLGHSFLLSRAKGRVFVLWGVLIGLCLVFFGLSLMLGAVKLSVYEVSRVLFLSGSDEITRLIVLELRLPRAILAALIGAILALSGAALQGLLRSPLAEASLFGAPQTAALCVVLMLSIGGAGAYSWFLPAIGIIGALFSVILLFGLAGLHAPVFVLILSGFAVSALAGAGTVLTMNLAPNPFAALEITFWLLGSLEDRSFRHVLLFSPFFIASLVLILSVRKDFRALTLGEEAAQSLGVHLGVLRAKVIWGVALGVGAATAIAGTIAFIGLIAPHIIRPFVGHDPARLCVPSAFCGAALLLAADDALRMFPATSDIKLGVLTSLIGAPFLIGMILHSRRSLLSSAQG